MKILNHHYLDEDNGLNYLDNSKFLDTIVHYPKHTGVSVFNTVS